MPEDDYVVDTWDWEHPTSLEDELKAERTFGLAFDAVRASFLGQEYHLNMDSQEDITAMFIALIEIAAQLVYGGTRGDMERGMRVLDTIEKSRPRGPQRD